MLRLRLQPIFFKLSNDGPFGRSLAAGVVQKPQVSLWPFLTMVDFTGVTKDG
jgi:hypothetical protein